MPENNTWLLVINPFAGNRKINKNHEHVFQLLSENNVLFRPVYTEYKNHAIRIAKDAVEKLRLAGIETVEATLTLIWLAICECHPYRVILWSQNEIHRAIVDRDGDGNVGQRVKVAAIG